jgi:hypothetical protein
MLNTPLISDMIFKGEVSEIKEIMKKSRNLGMQTFDQALFDAYETNVITYEDALRNADSVNDLRLQIKLNSQRAKSLDLAAGTEGFAIVWPRRLSQRAARAAPFSIEKPSIPQEHTPCPAPTQDLRIHPFHARSPSSAWA